MGNRKRQIVGFLPVAGVDTLWCRLNSLKCADQADIKEECRLFEVAANEAVTASKEWRGSMTCSGTRSENAAGDPAVAKGR